MSSQINSADAEQPSKITSARLILSVDAVLFPSACQRVLSDHQPDRTCRWADARGPSQARLDRLEALLVQTSTSKQDAVLIAEMLSPPHGNCRCRGGPTSGNTTASTCRILAFGAQTTLAYSENGAGAIPTVAFSRNAAHAATGGLVFDAGISRQGNCGRGSVLSKAAWLRGCVACLLPTRS